MIIWGISYHSPHSHSFPSPAISVLHPCNTLFLHKTTKYENKVKLKINKLSRLPLWAMTGSSVSQTSLSQPLQFCCACTIFLLHPPPRTPHKEDHIPSSLGHWKLWYARQQKFLPSQLYLQMFITMRHWSDLESSRLLVITLLLP